MDLDTARVAYESGKLSEVIIEPADEGNGWMLLVRGGDGGTSKITDRSGVEKIFHTIDHATEVAREIGFDTIRVEERF